MLTGLKKKLVKETISYFIDTTGLSEDAFILAVQKNRGKPQKDLNYPEWLALEGFAMLAQNGITLSDCLEFRKIAKQMKLEKQGVYVTPLWKTEIGKQLETVLTPESVLLEVTDKEYSELQYIKGREEQGYLTLGEIDYLSTLDFDEGNRYFLDHIPPEVRVAIVENKPLVLNINPYIAEKPHNSIMLEEMSKYGYKHKKLHHLYYQYLFRTLLLKEEYNLTNLSVGIYGPITMFKEEQELEVFYKHFRKHFQFKSGICFAPRSIGVVDRESLIGYTVWSVKKERRNNAVVLEEKVQHTEDTILTSTKRLIRAKSVSLHQWCEKEHKDLTTYEDVPILVNMNTFGAEKGKRGVSTLGYSMSSTNMLRMLKRVGITNLPMAECQEITELNFWQSVASYAVRVCLEDKIGLEGKFLNAPDTTIEGYSNWLADALILFLFGPSSMTVSYRREDIVARNRLFPLSDKDITRFITDARLLQDMEQNPAENSFIIEKLKEIDKALSKEAIDLLIFSKGKIRESLKGNIREQEGYKNNLIAWDSSIYQIRSIPAVFTPKEEQKYMYLIEKLKDKLYDGVYTYGFITENQ